MTDQQVYNSMLSGLTSAQLLALGANQAQVDAALIRMAAAAQGAENPAANGQGIQAGVQALQGLANGAVLNGIRKIKVVDYHQDTIQKYVSWGAIAAVLLGILLYFVWSKDQNGATKNAPTALSGVQTLTLVVSPIPPIKIDPIKIDVTGVLPGKP